MARMWSEALKFGGLAGLPHQVDEVGLDRRRPADGRGNPLHQQVGDHAGEQRPGPQRDHVGLGDGAERGGQRARLARDQADGAGSVARLRLMRVSPTTCAPSASVASSATFAAVEG